MKKNRLSFVIASTALLILSALSLASAPTSRLGPMQEDVFKRDLVLIGPAKDALLNAGFDPKGTIKLFATEEQEGIDRLRVDIEGLPPDTDFTVFLHELSDIPFGSSQYLAEMHTNRHGKASITIRTVIEDAFALKTAGNPPTIRLIDVDLDFVAIWFADSKDDDAFTNFPALAFDGDRDSGVVVLGTLEPLP